MNFNVFKWSLNTRITFLALTIFLVSVWLLTFYASHTQREDLQLLLVEQQLSTVSVVAADVDGEISDRLQALEKVATKITPAILGNAASMQTFLGNRPALEAMFNAGIFITGLDGTPIADVPVSANRIGRNVMDRDYMITALKEGKSSIGRPVLGKSLKTPVFSAAAPIRNAEGAVIGAIVGVTNLGKPNFLDRITTQRYGKTGGYLIVAPRQRQIVTATDKSRIMETLPAPGVSPFIDRAIQGFEGSGITTTPQGVQVLASTRGVPSAGWYVVALLPTAEAFAPIESMKQRMMLAALLLTLLAAGLTRWFVKIQRVKESLADQLAERVKELWRNNNFEHFRSEVLELVGEDVPVSKILEAIVRGVEQLNPAMLCSILLLDREGRHLGNGIGPSLPDFYNAAIDGIEIGMGVGSCGTAAFTGERVIVHDVMTHPYWAPFKELTARAGLGSCWSQPIHSSSGQVLGTFAIYHHEACSPAESEITLIEQSASLASIAIDKSVATEKLLSSEQRFRSFVENLNDVLFALTPEGIFNYVSPQWKESFGYELSETIGQPFIPFIHPDDVPSCLAFLQQIVETGKKQSGVEYRVLCKDGTYLCYRANGSLVKDPVDGTQKFVGIGRNVTEEKQAEDALKEAEELYHSLVETSQDLIWRCDTEGRYTYLNLAWEQVLGYDLENMLGKRFSDFMIHENAAGFEAKFNRMLDGGDALHGFEAIYRGKNGGDIHLVFNAILVCDKKGEYVGASGTAFNITERKLMENRLHETADQLEVQTGELQMLNESLEQRVYERTVELENEQQRLAGIMRGTNVGTWEWNVQTGETAYNNRWAEIIGYSLEEISPGSIEIWMKFGHPDDLKASRELLKKHFRGELDYYEFESRMKHKNGSWVWVLDRGKVATWSKDGKPLLMMGTHQDITESKKLKEQLMQSQKMEAVGQLAGGLAHDFNNVLSIINGYSLLLQMDMVMNEAQKEYFEKILAASKRAGELTHSMLAFSRTQVMNSQNQELNFVVSKVGSLVEKIIGDNITFKTITNEVNLPVYIDSGQIEQVLINLANNARDAMPNGGALEIATDSIRMDASYIAAHGFGKPGRYAVISVSDTGTGMDEATREKIFEPFFTTKAVGKGTGLGLAMVYGIVKQHKGYVDVYSKPGHGSCFKIYLPIVGIKAAGSGVKTVDGLEVSAGSETILIAEDNADLRMFMNKALTRLGYQVICAVDGQDAVDKFKENADKIQLLIMDMIMPNKSGKAAYDEIRQIRPETKALFSSGYSASIIQQQGELGENAEFISKPVQPAELMKKVREMLDR